MAVACQRLRNAKSLMAARRYDKTTRKITVRLPEDYGKTTGRRPEEHYAFQARICQKRRNVFAKPPRSLRDASAKLPRSHRGPTSMLRPFQAQPCSPVLEAQCLSYGRTSIREARRSHSAKSQSCREALPSQRCHEFWPREARRVASPAAY